MLLLLFIDRMGGRGGRMHTYFNGSGRGYCRSSLGKEGWEFEYCRWSRNRSVTPLIHSASSRMYLMFEQIASEIFYSLSSSVNPKVVAPMV